MRANWVDIAQTAFGRLALDPDGTASARNGNPACLHVPPASRAPSVRSSALCIHGYDTHALRRAKASLIYKAKGNLLAIQSLLGHANIENTARYLGVDVGNAIALAESKEI